MMKTYIKNNKEHYLCLVRQRLVLAQPEETVRQNMLHKLIHELKVPTAMITVEDALSHYEKGAKGRADIIVWYTEGSEDYPLLLIECKEPSKSVENEAHWNQLYNYNEILNAYGLAVVNGNDEYWVYCSEEGEEYKEIESLPTYLEILAQENIVFQPYVPYVYERLNHLQADTNQLYNHLLDEAIIGEDTPKKFTSFVANLYNLFFDTASTLPLIKQSDFSIIEDLGIRTTGFGNAGGGNWESNYRSFVISDEAGSNQIVSFAVISRQKTEKTEKTSASSGITTFVVTIDDEDEKSHNSLQLALDDYTTIDGNTVKIIHNGKITVGNLGAQKQSKTIDFVRAMYPEILDKDDKVNIATLDNSKVFSFENSDVQQFIINTIKYVLCREKFRAELKK